MTTILFISTIILVLAGVAFAGTYIWLNVFSYITDLKERNKCIIKILKIILVLSFVFPLLTCILINSENIESAIMKASVLYIIIAVSWLLILLGTGISLLYTFITKKTYKAELIQAHKKLFPITIAGVILGIIFAWLFS